MKRYAVKVICFVTKELKAFALGIRHLVYLGVFPKTLANIIFHFLLSMTLSTISVVQFLGWDEESIDG